MSVTDLAFLLPCTDYPDLRTVFVTTPALRPLIRGTGVHHLVDFGSCPELKTSARVIVSTRHFLVDDTAAAVIHCMSLTYDALIPMRRHVRRCLQDIVIVSIPMGCKGSLDILIGSVLRKSSSSRTAQKSGTSLFPKPS